MAVKDAFNVLEMLSLNLNEKELDLINFLFYSLTEIA
jgi:hypothetical protein